LPLARTLVTLKCDAEIPFSLDAARVRPIRVPKILPLFQQLGFHRFQDDVRRLADANGAAPIDGPSPVAGGNGPSSPPDASMRPAATAAGGEYEAITTRPQLTELVATLRSQPLVSVDTETTGLGRDAALCGLSF